jgi:hypothetical protein
MYSRITNIYDRKTAEQVFTKPVQKEGTQKFLFPKSCFFIVVTFLPLGDASVCSEKMAAQGERSFCVLEYHTTKSMVTVQCAFRVKYAKDPRTDRTICAWYKQFTETGCLCKQKSSGRPLTTEDDVEYHIVCCVTHGAHIKHV